LNTNENLILECLNELNKNALAKQKYKDYYEGNHSILKSYQMQVFFASENSSLLQNIFPRHRWGIFRPKPEVLTIDSGLLDQNL